MIRKLSLMTIIFYIAISATNSFASNEITKWRDNRAAAVSITFDDGRESQLTVGAPLLNSHNLKGTFFIISGFFPRGSTTLEQWQQAAEQGHEMASHSVTHPDLTQLSEEQVREELLISKEQIDQWFPYQSCTTFAYPSGYLNEEVESLASEYYIGARGIYAPEGGNLNHYYDGNGWSAVDFYNIAGQSILENPYAALQQAEEQGAWWVVYMHDVDAEVLSSFLDELVSRNIWVDTFGAVTRYMREKLASEPLEVISENSSEIKLNLTNSLAPGIYNEPLTIRSSVPSDWFEVRVQQGESISVVQRTIEEGETVVYYSAIPNKGVITLSRHKHKRGVRGLEFIFPLLLTLQ